MFGTVGNNPVDLRVPGSSDPAQNLVKVAGWGGGRQYPLPG